MKSATVFGMAALLAAGLAIGGLTLASQAWAQVTDPVLDEAINGAVQFVTGVSILVASIAGFVSWAIAQAKAKGLIKGQNQYIDKVAHGADYLAGTDEEVIKAKADLAAVARAMAAISPEADKKLREYGVDAGKLGADAQRLAGEVDKIHNIAKKYT